MKKIILLLCLFVSVQVTNAQLLNESFDATTFPPPGWTNTVVVGGPTEVWERVTTTTDLADPQALPHSGAGMAKYDSYNYDVDNSAALISPVLNMTSGGPYVVSFWMYRDDTFSSFYDSVEVFINTAASLGGATKLGRIERNYDQEPVVNNIGWYQYSFAIPASFNTASNYIIFKATSDYGAEMVIDDVLVAPAPAAPGCVTNISPANGATNVSTSLTISWNAAATASSYDVYFGTNNPPALIGNIAAPATSTGITGVNNGTTYFWYVVPKNVGGSATGCNANITSFTTVSAPPNCVPQTTNGCTFDDKITLFRVKGAGGTELNINTGTTCNANAYTDTTDHPTVVTLVRGESFWGQMQAGTTGDYVTLWLDGNDDGIYSNSERIMNNMLANDQDPSSFTLYIPAATPLGNHRLRARLVYFSNAPTGPIDACANYTYGDTKDFLVNITNVGSIHNVSTYAPGTSCYDAAGDLTIDAASNNNGTAPVFIVDSSNNYIAAIYPNGNNLGRVHASYFKNGGSVRFYQSTRPYLDRNLSITVAQQPTGPYSLRYFFQNAELNALIAQPGSGVTSVFDLVMTKNSDPCASAIGSTNAGTFHSPTGFGSLAGDRFLDFTGLTSFSSFYLHGGFGPLPVTLLSFEAQRTGKSNLVSWSTSQETNTDHFILERSTDGQRFTAIQRVAARGNSTISRSYSFLDREPARGYNYYRLQIVDRDNTAKFSGIRSVRNEGAADIALYPNPVVSSVNVSINADKAGRATIVISDLSGKQLSATNNNLLEGVNIVPVNVSKLAAGTYIIKIQLNGDMVVRKFDKL